MKSVRLICSVIRNGHYRGDRRSHLSRRPGVDLQLVEFDVVLASSERPAELGDHLGIVTHRRQRVLVTALNLLQPRAGSQ